MKIYAYTRIFHNAGTENIDIVQAELGEKFKEIANLYDKGFLYDDSIIWINLDYPELGMQVLSDYSSLVVTHRTMLAGWAVVNRQSVRFGRTARDAASRPSKSISRAELLDGGKTTIIVTHREPHKNISFQVGASVTQPVNGTIEHDPWVVIDLARYRGKGKTTQSPLELAKATLQGFNLLQYNTSPEHSKAMEEAVESYSFHIDRSKLEFLQRSSEKINDASVVTLREIFNNVRETVDEM